MSFWDSTIRKFGFRDEEEEYAPDNSYPEEEAADEEPSDDYGSRPYIKSSKPMNISATTTLKVIVVKPEKYSDAAAIADHFKNRKTVVLNLDNTNKDVANRLIDFLGGVAYATDGELKRIASMTYMIVPVNVEISGDMIDDLNSTSDLM